MVMVRGTSATPRSSPARSIRGIRFGLMPRSLWPGHARAGNPGTTPRLRQVGVSERAPDQVGRRARPKLRHCGARQRRAGAVHAHDMPDDDLGAVGRVLPRTSRSTPPRAPQPPPILLAVATCTSQVPGAVRRGRHAHRPRPRELGLRRQGRSSPTWARGAGEGRGVSIPAVNFWSSGVSLNAASTCSAVSSLTMVTAPAPPELAATDRAVAASSSGRSKMP